MNCRNKCALIIIGWTFPCSWNRKKKWRKVTHQWVFLIRSVYLIHLFIIMCCCVKKNVKSTKKFEWKSRNLHCFFLVDGFILSVKGLHSSACPSSFHRCCYILPIDVFPFYPTSAFDFPPLTRKQENLLFLTFCKTKHVSLLFVIPWLCINLCFSYRTIFNIQCESR